MSSSISSHSMNGDTGTFERTDSSEYQPTYAEAFPPLQAPTQMYDLGESAWNSVKPVPQSKVTQVFNVPVEERKYRQMNESFGETRQLQIAKEVMLKTGCTIEMSMAKDQSLSIMVTGPPRAVIQARRLILTQLQTQAQVDLRIPKEHHKFILGKGGSKLKAIELSTATKIITPRSDENSEMIKITGTKEGIDKAKHEIQLISDEQANKAFERLPIEKIYHPFVMGPNGDTQKAISQQTGARINIPPLAVMKDEITVAGDREAVGVAVASIRKIHEEKKRTCSTVSVEVRKTQHKYIVGPRGAGIQEILAATGVSVEMPSSESDSSTITLRGPPEKLGLALTQVYEKANSVVFEKVSAPRWLHRFIIGRKGQNVRKITQDLPKVHVEFSDEEEVVSLEGPPNEVAQAKEAFEMFTRDLMATMDFVEIHIDPRYHRHIIGKNGANVNRIKAQTGTSVIIPSDTANSDVIRIEGDPKGVKAAKQQLLEIASKMENERSKDIIIEQRFHRSLIGAGGQKIQELRDRFNGVQVMFRSPGEKSDVVTIRGPKDDVEKCAKHLKKLVDDLVESNYRSEVKVFKKFHANIIGKGGSTLKKIREETDTKIELPSEKSDSDVIVITGKKERVEKAKKMLLSMEESLANIKEVKVNIPQRLHNAIIGPKGRLIQSIMDECGGVRVHFPPPGSSNDEVRISGPQEDVERARKMILEMANETELEKYSVELHAKPKHHRFLIGRNGANIKKVREKFGARVMFPTKTNGDDSEIITIIGRKEKVDAAKKHMEEMIKDLENITEDTITVDPKHHRHFIQRRGQVLHEISEENGGVIISFPRSNSDSDKVTLKGSRDCIEGAKAQIQDVVKELESQVTMECNISRKHHRIVLGTKGIHVQEITQQHNVSIKFPDREDGEQAQVTDGETDPRDIIIITGRKENCEAASQALLDLVPVTVEVPVPYEYHRFIIGQRGREIRAMMEEYDVEIAVPQANAVSNHIAVSGPVKRVELAKLALERKVQQLDAEKEDRELRSFTLVLNVDPKHHPKIIGKRGANISKIRSDFDVQVQFPDKSDENGDQIKIIGYEHQAKAAQEAILQIVQELEEQICETIEVDHRVHSRLIGAKGKSIAKVMEQFQVDVRFPKDKNSNEVTIQGLEENVEDAKYHLLTLAEDYMTDVIEREEMEAVKRTYTHSSTDSGKKENNAETKGFVVTDAPWSTSDFPAIGVPAIPSPTTTDSGKVPTWGPRKKVWT